MKRYTSADMAIAEVQSLALQKKAILIASELQESILVLARELFKLDYTQEIRQRYTLYLKSPFDSHFTKIHQFNSLDSFCLWYLSRHPYKDFQLINYTECQ